MSPKSEKAITIGRNCAYALFLDLSVNECVGKDLVFEKAKEKLNNQNTKNHLAVSQPEAYMELKKIGVPSSFMDTIAVDRQDLELVGLVRNGSHVLLQFSLVDPPIEINGKNLSFQYGAISEKGPASMFIDLCYKNKENNSLKAVILDKISHLPVIDRFYTYNKFIGVWALTDFEYNYTLNEYIQWLKSSYESE